jgi:hypothetical protein
VPQNEFHWNDNARTHERHGPPGLTPTVEERGEHEVKAKRNHEHDLHNDSVHALSAMSALAYASFSSCEGVEFVCEAYREQRVSVLRVNDEIAPHGSVCVRQTIAFAFQ